VKKVSDKKGKPRQPATGRGLFRETAYLHADELAALQRESERRGLSRAEIIRRALRKYLGVED